MSLIRAAVAAAVFAAIVLGTAVANTVGYIVNLDAQNGSGEAGTATLLQKADGVEVIITLANAGTAAQPAHIHEGTCAKLNLAPKYPLNNVVNGTSTTTVHGVTIADLLKSPVAINVHKSADDLKTYVACGDNFMGTTADVVSAL
jgi:hypothetical protein